MARKRKITKGQKTRLVDIEIDEISLVDKPAIGETFIITKRVKGKGVSMSKKKKQRKQTMKAVIQKCGSWSSSIKKFVEEKHKAVDNNNTHCKFCGISAEDEAKTLGMGLLCSCCFECAVERMDKGVFDACISGEFDFDKYKEENPDEFTKDADAEGDEADDTEKNADGEDGEKDKDKEGEESEDEDGEDEGEESEDEEKDDTEKNTDEPKDEGAEKDGTEKRVEVVEKKLEDVESMLQTSLEFHSQAAGFLNSIVAMTMDALDMVMMLREENGTEQSEKVTKSISELKEVMKQFRGNKDIQKAGAKISSARLNALKEIADKLAALISSVSGETEKEGKKGGKKAKAVKSEDFEDLKKQFTELQKSLDDNDGKEETIKDLQEQLSKALTKVDELANRLNDVEKGAVGSSEVDDDDDEDDDDETDGGDGSSVFKGFGPLAGVTERIQKTQRLSTKKK